MPWSQGRDFDGPLNGDAWEAKDSKLSAVAQDSLILNLLTEDNLPGYGRKAVGIALAGVYDLEQHLNDVVAPHCARARTNSFNQVIFHHV